MEYHRSSASVFRFFLFLFLFLFICFHLATTLLWLSLCNGAVEEVATVASQDTRNGGNMLLLTLELDF
jgi:hypothetical protein